MARRAAPTRPERRVKTPAGAGLLRGAPANWGSHGGPAPPRRRRRVRAAAGSGAPRHGDVAAASVSRWPSAATSGPPGFPVPRGKERTGSPATGGHRDVNPVTAPPEVPSLLRPAVCDLAVVERFRVRDGGRRREPAGATRRLCWSGWSSRFACGDIRTVTGGWDQRNTVLWITRGPHVWWGWGRSGIRGGEGRGEGYA